MFTGEYLMKLRYHTKTTVNLPDLKHANTDIMCNFKGNFDFLMVS